MQYQSIIRFLDYSNIDYGDPAAFNISRAKKLANAEFAMQPDGIIVIDGFSYTRQDIFSELEHADFPLRLQFHKIIWEHKGLLTLLEQDRFELYDGDNWYPLYNEPGFVSFISPYFSVVFNRVMRPYLNENDLAAAAGWLDYLCFVEPQDEEEALRNTRIYLSDAVRFFRNLNDTSYKSRSEELRMWHTTSWSNFINKLPGSLLSYVDEIVSAIINFTVRIQKSNRKLCYKISRELLNVNNANYSLLQLILSNHDAYTRNYRSKTLSGWLKSGVNIVYVIMLAILALSKVFSSDSDDSYSPAINTNFEISDFSVKNFEINNYKEGRELYRKTYGSNEKVFYMVQKAISEDFDATHLYLLIEGAKKSPMKLTPFAIKNNSADTIGIRILRADSVCLFNINPGSSFNYRPLSYQSVDMYLIFEDSMRTKDVINYESEKMQSFHIGPKDAPNDTAYSFYDNFITDIPDFSETELSKIPLVISIYKRKDKFYIKLKGNGNIVYEKGKDAVVATK